jgi:hypothetical protein
MGRGLALPRFRLQRPLTLASLAFLEKDRAVAQLGSALEWGSRGRGFESRRPDDEKLKHLSIRHLTSICAAQLERLLVTHIQRVLVTCPSFSRHFLGCFSDTETIRSDGFHI